MPTINDVPAGMHVNLKEKVALFYDNGLFIEQAITLSKSFKKVYYYMPWKNGFPKSNQYIVGVGLEGIERIYDFFDYVDEADVFIFPDVYDGDLQKHLVSLGKNVWGGRKGEEMELNREGLKKYMEAVGLYVTPYKVVKGLDKLREYLKIHENVYVKINKTRGDMETFRSDNYKTIEPVLDQLEHDLGAIKKIKEFIVENCMDNAVEAGLDCYTIDGEFPSKTLNGLEIKDCYDDQTEILTDLGWKLFKDLDKTEKVFTLNTSDTRHIRYEFQIPTDYIDRSYNGEMIRIEKEGVSLCVTPTHNLLVQDGIQNELVEEVTWGGKIERLGKEKRTFKRGKRVIRLQKAIDLVNRKKKFSLFQPKGIYISNNPSCYKIEIDGKKCNKIDFARFMGAYLSEGYARIRNGKGEVNISQFKYVKQFEDVIKKIPFKYTRTKSGFNIYNKELAEYCLQFGVTREKFIPVWIKEASKDVINAFLDIYCLGDGSFNTNYKKIRKDSAIYNENFTHKILTSRYFYTSSKKMADDLQELLVKVGSVALSRIDKEYYNEKEKINCLMYGVQEKLINRKNYVFPEDIEFVEYSGKVYCVTVPNSIIMIRRNGKSMWCGNCGYVGVITPYDEISKRITNYDQKVKPLLKAYSYRGFYSTEIRIDKTKEYMLDHCSRAGSPPNELYQLMYKNLAEIIWYGAQGFLIDPETDCKFGVETLIHSSWADKNWQAIDFPEKFRENIKLRNACKIDGRYYAVPQSVGLPEIGAIVTEGNTLQEAIDKIKEIADSIEGHYIEVKLESIDKAMEEFKKLEEFGVKII